MSLRATVVFPDAVPPAIPTTKAMASVVPQMGESGNGGRRGRGRPTQQSLRPSTRTFTGTQQAVTLPADPHEPGARPGDDWLLVSGRWLLTPAIEPPSRRVWVVVATSPVLRPVLKHIEQRSARLARGLELMCMVAVGEDGAAVSQCAMDRARHANREPLHAARKGLLVRGLDDQMQMIRLNRKVNDAKSVLLAGCD